MSSDKSARVENYVPVKVLVIDDQAFDLGYKKLLTMLGYDVQIEASGYRGVERAQRFMPDVILLDYQMPGIDGIEVARRLRSGDTTAGIPIIMISMMDDPDNATSARQAGINDYVSKPIDPDELDRKIGALVPRRKSASLPTDKKVRIGGLYKKPPEMIVLELKQHPVEAWGGVLSGLLEHANNRMRGRAVIALAAWQSDFDAPFNPTDGHLIFWKHIRHSLASSTATDAEVRWSKLTPIAAALVLPLDKYSAALTACASDSHWECRAWAMRIFISNNDMTALRLAETALYDDSGEVRTMAAQVFARMGSGRHIPVLAQGMSDTEPGVRENIAAALARIGGDLSASVLTTVLLEGRAGAAEAASNGLALMGTEAAVQALITGAETRTEPAVLQQIAHALGKLRTDRCLAMLRDLAGHPDIQVARAAQHHLF